MERVEAEGHTNKAFELGLANQRGKLSGSIYTRGKILMLGLDQTLCGWSEEKQRKTATTLNIGDLNEDLSKALFLLKTNTDNNGGDLFSPLLQFGFSFIISSSPPPVSSFALALWNGGSSRPLQPTYRRLLQWSCPVRTASGLAAQLCGTLSEILSMQAV